MGQYKKSLTILNKSLEIDPNNADILCNRPLDGNLVPSREEFSKVALKSLNGTQNNSLEFLTEHPDAIYISQFIDTSKILE
ncbi:9008_t:CDS:2, partial [Cetraspora pellucida]